MKWPSTSKFQFVLNMINVLSYIGMNLRSEVCLWTILGIIRTIFDATLFRVNTNLKQIWQMTMPVELSMPVQRALRTMISGVMLVQCFTVYIYLASYIVLLYPVFLEERPNLVLPWLLLAAVRKLLCELTSLALGLGTCVLLGPARPPCIKFLIIKIVSITPSFYMWMLLFSYYHSLKVASMFKKFPTVLPAQPGDQDDGLELAIRRRKTKSLLGEDQLRSKIVASLYGGHSSENSVISPTPKAPSRMMHSTVTSDMDLKEEENEFFQPSSFSSNQNCMSETGSNEDWFGTEVIVPRGCDRILEQFVNMLLRIKVYLEKKDLETVDQVLSIKPSHHILTTYDNLNCTSLGSDEAETSFLVGSSKNSNTASYIQEYPHIFMRKSDGSRGENKVVTTNIQATQEESNGNTVKTRRRTVTVSSNEKIIHEVEKIVSHKKYVLEDKSQLGNKSNIGQRSDDDNELKQKTKAKVRNAAIKIKPNPELKQILNAHEELLSDSSDKENKEILQNNKLMNKKPDQRKRLHQAQKSSNENQSESFSSSDDESSDTEGKNKEAFMEKKT